MSDLTNVDTCIIIIDTCVIIIDTCLRVPVREGPGPGRKAGVVAAGQHRHQRVGDRGG